MPEATTENPGGSPLAGWAARLLIANTCGRIRRRRRAPPPVRALISRTPSQPRRHNGHSTNDTQDTGRAGRVCRPRHRRLWDRRRAAPTSATAPASGQFLAGVARVDITPAARRSHGRALQGRQRRSWLLDAPLRPRPRVRRHGGQHPRPRVVRPLVGAGRARRSRRRGPPDDERRRTTSTATSSSLPLPTPTTVRATSRRRPSTTHSPRPPWGSMPRCSSSWPSGSPSPSSRRSGPASGHRVPYRVAAGAPGAQPQLGQPFAERDRADVGDDGVDAGWPRCGYVTRPRPSAFSASPPSWPCIRPCSGEPCPCTPPISSASPRTTRSACSTRVARRRRRPLQRRRGRRVRGGAARGSDAALRLGRASRAHHRGESGSRASRRRHSPRVARQPLAGQCIEGDADLCG